jgi:hypothetical protein
MWSVFCLWALWLPASPLTAPLRADRAERCALPLSMIGLGSLAIRFHHRPHKRKPGEPPRCDTCG